MPHIYKQVSHLNMNNMVIIYCLEQIIFTICPSIFKLKWGQRRHLAPHLRQGEAPDWVDMEEKKTSGEEKKRPGEETVIPSVLCSRPRERPMSQEEPTYRAGLRMVDDRTGSRATVPRKKLCWKRMTWKTR